MVLKIALAITAIMSSILIWPLLLPISFFAIWFYTKKKPDKIKEKYAKNAAVISILGLLIFFNMNLDDTEETARELDSTEIVADVEAEKADEDKKLEEKLQLE